jgi:hypothetical protein
MHRLEFVTPRKLPKARQLPGRVVVLDIAFAQSSSGDGFARITLPFIEGLGERLAAWVDHHDHDEHARFVDDPRFVLSTKARYGSCPEMIDPALVERIGPVDTVVCHNDFDGLAAAAKWIRGGIEPYPGCDADARAVDTRLGKPSPPAERMDRALRGRPRDFGLCGVIVRHLVEGLKDASLWEPIDEAVRELLPVEQETRRAASAYVRVPPGVAMVDVTQGFGRIDKTLLLLLGQEREPVSLVVDRDTLNLAARFDSGISFVDLLELEGGMPTRVSVPRSGLASVLRKLGVESALAERLAAGG